MSEPDVHEGGGGESGSPPWPSWAAENVLLLDGNGPDEDAGGDDEIDERARAIEIASDLDGKDDGAIERDCEIQCEDFLPNYLDKVMLSNDTLDEYSDDMKGVADLLGDLAASASHPAVRHWENENCRFTPWVHRVMSVLFRHGQVQRLGLFYFSNMARDNPPFADSAANSYHIGIIVQTMRGHHRRNRKIREYGMMALSSICRQSRNAAQQVAQDTIAIALIKRDSLHPSNKIAQELLSFLHQSRLPGFDESEQLANEYMMMYVCRY